MRAPLWHHNRQNHQLESVSHCQSKCQPKQIAKQTGSLSCLLVLRLSAIYILATLCEEASLVFFMPLVTVSSDANNLDTVGRRAVGPIA